MNRLNQFIDWWRARPERWMVVLLTLLTLTKGVAWISLFPMWKIADEPAHFDDIQFRSEHGLKSPIDLGHKMDPVMNNGVSQEMKVSWKAAQSYYRELHHKFLSTVPEEGRLAQLAKDPRNRDTDGQMPAIGYPGLYYTLGTIPYRWLRDKSVINRVFAVRMLSMMFGLMAVLATFFAARRVFDAPEPAFAAAVLVDLHPMFSQQTAAVSNDSAVFGLCALAFVFQLRMLNRVERNQRFVDGALLGVSVGLAILSKGQGYVMLLTSVLLLAWLAWGSWRAAWPACVTTLAGYGLVRWVGMHWPAMHVKNLAPGTVAIHSTTVSFPYSYADILGELWQLVGWIDTLDKDYRAYLYQSTWGQFSWLEFAIGSRWLDAIWNVWPLISLGLVGAIVLFMVRRDSLWWRTRPAALAALTALIAVMSIFYVEFHERASRVGSHVIQGRNFLFAAPAFSILMILGLGSLVPKKFRGLTLAMAVTASMCLNVGAFLCVLRQHYGG